jgi:hypothetical protein
MNNQIDINNSLNLLLEKSLYNEIGYLKIIKHIDNHEMLEFLDNRHEASCLRVIALKDCFLDANIEFVYDENEKEVVVEEWLDVKSILKKKSKKEIFDEILIAEQKCLANYNQLLTLKSIPKKVEVLLRQQKKGIESSIVNLNLFRD